MKNLSLGFIAILIISTLVSCSSQAVVDQPVTPKSYDRRVQVLEDNTVSFVTLNPSEQNIYYVNDTVWVNLATHTINDTAENTMKCVIKLNIK